jgi:hypothetical protein
MNGYVVCWGPSKTVTTIDHYAREAIAVNVARRLLASGAAGTARVFALGAEVAVPA